MLRTKTSFGAGDRIGIKRIRINQAAPLPYILVSRRCVCCDIHLGAAPLVCLPSLSERN
jgi:hypothetical protein